MSDRGMNLTQRLLGAVLLSLTAMFCLFSTAFAAAQTTLSTNGVHFGFVALNEKSAIQTVTVFNHHPSSVNISSLVVSGPGFALDPSTTCANPGTLGANSSCMIGLTFTPGAIGTSSGSLVITTTGPSATQTVTLSGTEIAPATLSTAALQFLYVGINQTSPILTTTLTNHQLTALGITSLVVSGPGYALDPSTTCGNPGTLAANTSCTIGVTFTPTTTGTKAGTLVITTTNPSAQMTVTLGGTGEVATTLSANGLSFGFVALNQTSAVKTVTLMNNQSSALGITSLVVSGPGFALDPSTTCGNPGTLAGFLASCTIGLTFTPTGPGTQSGTLVITTTNPSTVQTVTLSGTETAPTSVLPSTLQFGNVGLNLKSAIKTVTLTNYQSTALGISSLVVSGSGYALDPSTTCANPGTLAANSSCTIGVTLTPGATGFASGTLVVTTTAPSSQQTVTLQGTGIVSATLLPATVNFGSVVVGQTSAIQTVTLTNNLSSSISVSSLAVTAGTPYAITPSSTCLNPTLGAGLTCTVGLTLTPSSVGVQPAGTLTVTLGGGISPLTVGLSGTGVASVTLTPGSIAFGGDAMGTTSAAKTLTLTNNQASSLSVTGSVFNGPFVLDTSVVTTCPMSGGALSGSLASGTSCVIGVDFKPTAAGPTAGGQITVLDSASNSPQLAALSGTGLLPVGISPTTLPFGNVAVGATSTAGNVSVTNNQMVALHFSSITAPAPYAIVPATTTCVVGTPVAPGGSCTISLTFTPASMGPAAASVLNISNDAPTTPQTVNLTGAGVSAVSLSANTLVFGTVVVGQPVVKSLTLRNNQGVPLNISSITGFTGGYSLSSTNTTCPLTPPAVPANSSCVIAVSLTATATGAQPGTISISDDAPSTPQVVTLTGNAIQPVALSAKSLSFAAQFVGFTSAAGSVTLTNEQSVGLHISSVAIAGADPNDFAIATNTCPISTAATPVPLPASSPCSVSVTFTPTASGTRTATLTFTDDALGSPQTVNLTGAGNAPVVITADAPFTANVGATSAFQTFTVTNEVPNTPLHISNFKYIGPFIQTATTCPTAPAALGGAGAVASCTLSIQFDPTVGGVIGGQLQAYDDALTSPQVVNLTGTATNPLTISPAALSFSAQTVGTVSPAKVITLTNHESQSETFSLAAVGSLAAGDYQASSNCTGGVIAANSNCLISVNFTPTSVTPSTTRGGTLTIANSATNGAAAPGASPVTAPLAGSATATNPAPAVSVVSPGAGAAGTTVNVTITGNGWTHFSSSSAISFSDINSGTYPVDITVQSFTAPNPNTILATLVLTANTVANPVTYGARNIKIVTPLSGGGSETASLISAFIIADPNNQHTITSVTPAFGIQGQTLSVALTATGTNFSQGVTYANFGDGISINYLTVTDATDAVANITISNTTYVGYRTVTLVTGGEFATSGPNAFQIGPNSATLTGVTLYSTATSSCTSTPVVEPQGFSGAVCLTATGTHFLLNATQVSITGGIIVGDVQVTSPTTAVAQVAVQASATIGLQNVTVSTGGEIATLNNSFTVTGATPYLISVAPSSGQQGQTLDVILTGNAYTTFAPGVYTPPFNGPINADFTGEITVNKITVSSASSVDVNITISPNANVGGITATLTQNPNGGATLFQFGFSVTPSSAAITSVTPSCVPQGGQLTLTVVGSNTLWVQGTTTAAFYPVPVPAPSFDEITIVSQTNASLAVAVPTNTPPGAYGFYLATGGQVVSATMNVCAATPTLTVSPANGLLPSGAAVSNIPVSFTGQFTKWGASTVPVISGEGVTLTGFNITGPTSATGTISIVGATNGTPTATGPRLITFTTGGEIDTTYFNVTKTPVGIIYISPWEAPQSTTLNVELTGLNTHWTSVGPNPTTVSFGLQITVNSVTVTDATHLTANITTSYMLSGVLTPSPAGWQQIYVNTGAEQLLGGFLVESPAQPSLVSVCVTGTGPLTTSTVPCVSSAQQGASVDVTITGSSNPSTNWVQGTTEAILGAGVSIGNLTITSPNTATATIAVLPTAPVGGNSVIMITGNQIVSGSGFSVTPNAALISSVGPAGVCNANAVTIANFCGISGGSGTPYVIGQLQTATLNIVGVGTHWLQGETTVNFGPGVAIDVLTVNSPTTATVQITVLSTSPVGYAPLTTITGGEVVTLQQAIDIEEGFPALLAMSPSTAPQNDTFTLQVLGRFTNWGPTTTAAFNQDITVNSVNVIDSDNLQLNVTVTPWAYVDYGTPCGHVLTVTTGTQQVVGSNPPSGVSPSYFCVTQGGEEITSVAPLVTIQGSTVPITITGSATNFIQGVTQVSFSDPGFAVGQITVNSPTSLTVPVAVSTAATPGFKTVTVTTYGQVASQQYSFTVSPTVATLNEAIPNQAEQGAPIITSPTCSTLPNCMIRLIGQYSHFSSLSTATFGAGITVQSISYVSSTEVDAYITIDPLSYPGGRLVTVTTPGVPCSDQPPVAVTNLSYAGCTPGVPTGTGSEIVSNNIFTVIPGPAIISNVSPNTGNEGQEIVANITGVDTHWAQNFTQFYIAGGGYDITINSVVINSATSATVDLSISPTANPGARSIYMVTNGESLTDSGAFVVTGGIPAISYVSPNSAVYGTTGLEVTIVGNQYTQWTSASTISFGPGITIESEQWQDASHIQAILDIGVACTSPGVPAGCAQVGYRTVVVQTGAQGLTGNFQVTAPPPPPTPYIWYENPSSGIPGQTLTINFVGYYTQWNPGSGEACSQSGTTITGFNADVTVDCFQVTSPTTAYATVSVSPTAQSSFSTLTLTTTGTTFNPSTEVDYGGFSVVVAQPTLSVVDPGAGMQGAQNLTVNIIGQFTAFDSTTTFNFGQGITTNGPPTILGPTIATQSINIAQLAQQGGRSVVSTTPDASAANQVTVGGAGFSVTPSLALILSVSPNTAAQGGTISVTVTGQNTHWAGSTTFQFGAGIVVTSTNVTSNTTANLTLAIPAYAPEGPTYVQATTLGEIATLNNGFVVQAGTPYLLSSGPGSEPQQGSAVFTILSQATTWLTNPPTVSYGPGIVVTNVNVTSNTSLTADGYVLPTTPVGWYPLTVTTGSQVLGLTYGVYVSPGPAAINSVSPNTGGQGANLPSVTITGTNTHWSQGTTTLNFPDVLLNSWSVTSSNTITANLTVNSTAPAGEISVTATTLGEVATGTNVFDITQTQPELLSVVTSSGPSAGTSTAAQGFTGTVNLTGQFTSFNTAAGCSPNCSTANFGTGITVNSVTALSATSLQANITVSPTTTLGYRSVSVTTGSQVVSLNNAFQVTVGPAAITALLSPDSGPQGASNFTVNITGSQTHWVQGVTTASFGGGIQVTGLTINGLLSATATISIPNGTALGAYNVTLTTGGEVATELGAFTVTTGSPYISAVSPPTGTQGTNNLSINITGQFTHFNTAAGCSPNCSAANFGAGINVVSTTASDATHAVAIINISPTATIASRNVSVVTGAETASITGGFSVLAGVPQLVSAVQNFAQAGTTANVVITGEFTTFQAGFLSVSFGSGVTTNFISNVSLTQLTANITVASNATVGSRDITVTANGTPLTLSGGFNVTAGTPVITQINPSFGNPNTTALSVTITGQYTNWTAASTVTIGTAADGITVEGAAGPGLPGPVVAASATATSVTVLVDIASGAPLGPADVTVTTGGSPLTYSGGFTVQPVVIPAPSLLSFSPGVNVGGIVPINSNFIAVFSQPMNRTTFTNSGTSGTVVLYLTSNPGGWTPISATLSVDAAGRVLTITPSSLLAVNSQYYIELTSGIKDATAAGNSFSGFYQYLYTEFSANTTVPTVVETNPPANATNVGTNVPIQLEFSTAMDQETASGLTVSSAGGNVAGTVSWNSDPPCCTWGPGNILYFTPTAPLAANTVYTVSYGAPLADTAGNALTPGSFTFTTGPGADTAQNYTGSDIANNQTNIGTNVAPVVTFSKPINPLDINTGTVLMYNGYSGKYINGTVTVAPNGLSATFTPAYQLLPETYYHLHMSWGNYDMDGQYLNGIDTYFTTGNGADLVAPAVASVSPANNATAVPLNSQVVVRFSSPINPDVVSGILTVTPSGGSPIAGTATLASDLVTLTFVPTTILQPATVYTVAVSGYQDVVGNVGAAFSSTFTTATSVAPINLSTGFNASGQLITTNNTADANWVYYPQTGTPSETTFGSPSLGTAQPLLTVGPGDTGWYSGWGGNGPGSDWININPNSTTGNTFGLYYTTFNISGSVPSNLCLVGGMSIDDNGLLAINGTAITGNISGQYSLYPLNIPISSNLVVGQNVLALGWGSTDNYDEAFRLQASIQTCGASLTGNLSLVSATPSNGATSVPTNTTITLQFNNPLNAATVNDTTLPVMIGWNSNQIIAGTWAVNGAQATFTPDSPFPTSTQIYVGNCNGPYDLAGDTYPGCYEIQWLNFTTASTATPVVPPTPPFQVMAFTPTNGSTGIGLNAPVVATFNRSFNPNSINSSDLALFENDGQGPWCTSYNRSQDNATIQFNCGTMPSSATMTAILNSGISDWSGSALTSFSSQFTTNYYDSNTNGSVIGERPGNGASGVSANLPFVLYANLPINPSGANAGIEFAQNNVAVPGTVNVLDGGYTLEFTPSVPWTAGALIQWWITGSLTDTTYNTPISGGTTSGYFYVAASTSTLVPALQVASPAYGATAALNSFVDLQFNTPLAASTVNNSNVYLYDASTGLTVSGTYSQPQPNEVRIVPSANFAVNHYIYVYVTTSLTSTTSVPFGSNTWVTYFYTGTAADSTLPTITSAVPYNGATGVGVNVTPGVIISKSIDPVSVNSNTFQVTNGGSPLAGGFWFNSGDTRVEFVPNAPLPANTNLVMTLNGVLDTVGNPITFSSSFTTGPVPDTAAPTIVWTSIPNNGSVPTNSSLTVQFSESMDVTSFINGQPNNCGNFYIQDQLSGDGIGCIATTLTWNATQTVAYLTPNAPLAAGRQYYLYVYGGTDLAGNTVQGTNFNFYAGFNSASTAPTVIDFNPLNGATGLGTNVQIEAQFSGPIDPNTLSGVTLSQGGSTVPTSPSMSAANTILQLIPAAPLAANTIYTMTIAGVKDPAGNTVATVTNSFTTGPTYDIAAPSVVTLDPPNNATVGTNVAVKIVFNKPLNPITVSNSSIAMVLNDTGQWIPLTVTQSANGSEITLTPQIALLPNTTYRYYVSYNNYVQDQDGNTIYAGWYYFTTSSGAVSTGPTVTVSPMNGATAIPLNAQVLVSVSAPIDPTSWSQNSIQLLNGATPVAGTVSEPDNEDFTFVPTNPLTAATTYTVNVSGFKDANGNAVVPSSTTFTTGSAAATGGLSFTSSNITNGATGVSATQQIIMTFSQILDPTTVNANTLKVMNSWNSNLGLAGTYAVSGNQVTFTPLSPYPAGASIYVGECGGPTDILGDVFQNGGCYYQQLVWFTVTTGTPDTTSLQVVSVSPASGATNVGRDQSVTVTFNKSVSPGSTGGYNTQLFAGQGLQTNGSVTMSADDRTITFNIGALYNGTAYTISIPAGGVTDMSGNGLQNTFISTFTTTADPATGNGGVQASNPGNTSGVPTDTLLTLYMNRQVNPSTLPGQLTVTVNGQVYAGSVTATAGNWEIQFTPTVAFPNSATVQWFLSGGVRDVYGDAFNGNSGYFYTAAAAPNPATAQPQVIAVSPGTGTSHMPTNGEVDIEYSQPIDATTLSGNVYLNSGPSTPTFSVALASPNVVRITPNAPWNEPNIFYGFCTNASVKGTNGVAAQSDCWATYFYTAAGPDTTPGTVTIGPPNGVVNVGTNAYIRLQFSKPVDRTTINSTNVSVTANGNPVPGSWSFNYSSSDVVGANFSPVNPLPPSATVVVGESGLLDYAGNTFPSASSTFTTGPAPDYTSPTVTLDFGYWQSGIATNASFNCHYSEAMDPSSVTASNTYIYSYVNNGNIPVTFTWSSDLMTVTMTPTTPLFADSQYVYYCNSALDLTGNGQQNNSAGFYTGSGPSSAGPVLVSANPPSGATNVPVNSTGGPWNNSSLMLLFNEPFASESIGNITFTPSGGSAEPIGVYAEDGNYIANVVLPWALQPNTTYTFNVAGVTDLNGNPASGITTSSFTTGTTYDYTNPTATAASPANGVTTTGIPATVTLTFSEVMNPVLITSSQIYLRTHNTQTTVPTTLSAATVGGVTVVTLTPTTPLTESTIYDLVYWPNNWYLYDIAGNYDYQYGVESTFTTGTTAAVNGACGTANGSTFAAPPTANLCSAGTASGLTNVAGTFSWSCSGQYGGTAASCSATVTPASACYAQPAGLVSWWKGDDDATDHMGNNNGTLENGASFAVGEVNDAFSFNGSNEYVLIGQPVPADLQIQNNFTLSAWIYVTSYPANVGSGPWQYIFGSEGPNAGLGLFLAGPVSGSYPGVPPGGIDLDIGKGSATYSVITTSQIPLNQWVLVTATATANNPAQIYYNGVLQPAMTPSGETVWNGTVPYTGAAFAIGQYLGANYAFNGLIDEVQVYNAALSAAQVQGIYNAGNAGVCP
ncbi:MAG: Ig-like domain-containing protein [Terracidiphilus sp.]